MMEKPWEYDGRIIALTRNVESLFEAIKRYEQMRTDDAARVELLQVKVSEQEQQIVAMQQKLATMQAKLYETGIR